MTWFERLWGQREPKGQQKIEDLFTVEEQKGRVYLTSQNNGRRVCAGYLKTPTLAEIRERYDELSSELEINHMRSALSEYVGDVQELHCDPSNAGALFQVASQVNLLEMASPHTQPIDGVEIYEYDRTQGPACAISAGAGTVYRNYFFPHGPSRTHRGQLNSQVNTLDDLHKRLLTIAQQQQTTSDSTEIINALWPTKNGYVLPNTSELHKINTLLRSVSEVELDRLRSLCKIGVHCEVEVTLDPILESKGYTVNQAYCSALPIGYSQAPTELWEPFARLVLEAAYEHTLKSAAINYMQGGSPRVFLTKIGGGVFQNPDEWIYTAIDRALKSVDKIGLDVQIVSYGKSERSTRSFIERWCI